MTLDQRAQNCVELNSIPALFGTTVSMHVLLVSQEISY